ncbi:MAG: hypothetical protein COB38_05820 [Gammaproteobacteria bacterium]|nr:MAG: hypothetical protein COB38_05820 [Gammaproteobacteria bacterium]
MLIILLGSFDLQATEYWQLCNSCSEGQRQNTAKQQVPIYTQGIVAVYIMDYENEEIFKYNIFGFNEPAENLYFSAARSVVVEQDIENEYVQFVTDFKAAVEEASGITMPGGTVNSSFDIIHSSYNRGLVTNHIANNLSFFQTIAATAGIPLLALNKLVNINLVTTVTFPDGSTAIFNLTGVSGSFEEGITFEFEYKEGTAKDSNGNTIPESAAQANNYQGTYNTQSAANTMTTFISSWYSGGGLICTSVAVKGKVVVTCKKE